MPRVDNLSPEVANALKKLQRDLKAQGQTETLSAIGEYVLWHGLKALQRG